MLWTGIGCLIQCINSIVWNNNMVNRAPVYCDIGELIDALSCKHSLTICYPIVTHFQIGLNVAIPACSLCINRRLFKITRGKVVMVTPSEKRRAVFIDLIICIVPPILQMIVREFLFSLFFSTGCSHGFNAEYVVALNRYNIYEDYGPVYSNHLMPETFILFFAWPVVIGCISLVYCGECF